MVWGAIIKTRASGRVSSRWHVTEKLDRKIQSRWTEKMNGKKQSRWHGGPKKEPNKEKQQENPSLWQGGTTRAEQKN